MSTLSRSLALYIHIPFCAKHCAYCDFNTYVEKAQSRLVQETVDALCQDIETARPPTPNSGGEAMSSTDQFPQTEGGSISPTDQFPQSWGLGGDARLPVSTIFFGGGTPTFLSGEQLARILRTIRDNFAVEADAEISSEANPGSSDAEKFAVMREAGFNRLSIGVQAFDDGLLVALDRFHTAGEAEQAVRAAREAGFTNLNLDLMFGLPKQTLPLWQSTLESALALQPEHLSLYALTLEPGTRFERLEKGGKLPLPDEDTELEMYERCITTLTERGYEHYEVSNFARPGFRCQHNQVYWRNEEYLGFGPGAVSYWEGRRWKRERLPLHYVRKVREGVDLAVESETLDAEGTLGETMMLGLRMREGLPLARIRERFQRDLLEVFRVPIAQLTAEGMILLENDTLRLTHQGLLFANDVLSAFLFDPDEH